MYNWAINFRLFYGIKARFPIPNLLVESSTCGRRSARFTFPFSRMIFKTTSSGRPTFDGHLHFDIHLLSHKGNSAWVEPTIIVTKECLMSGTLPESNEGCEFCAYRRESQRYEVGG